MRLSGICLTMLVLASMSAAAGGDRPIEPLHVLLLHSYERDFAPHGQLAESMRKDLVRRSPRPVNFFDVSVQPARATTTAREDGPALEYLLSTFAGQRLDLIVSIGGPAARFAIRHRERLFPATPLLLGSVDRQTIQGLPLPANTAAVAVANDAARIVETALSLLPDTTTVHVVIGTSELEEFWRGELSREFHKFRDRLTFQWLNGLGAAEILRRSATLPRNSIIFYSILSFDANGAPQVEQRMLSDLHAVAAAPIFGFHSGQLGAGIVGGPLLSIEQASETMTSAALRMLQGEPAASIRVPIQVPGTPTFDSRELRRWHIAEGLLPPGSVIRFREPTTWERYRWQIVFGTVFAFLQASLVVALLTIQVKRRRAERARHESEERFRLLADCAPVMVWMAGVDKLYTDVNRPRLEFTGRTAEQERGQGWLEGVHADDARTCLATYLRAFDRREPFRMEYRLRRHDGIYRWVLDTGVPRFDSHGAFVGYIGSCIDVTDLKLARAALSNLSQRLMQSHEGERAEVARELHEDLSQRLAGLTMQLHVLTRSSLDENLRTRVGGLCEQFGDLGRDIQAISRRLYSQKLEYLGLAGAVNAMCRDVTRQHAVTIDLINEGVPDDVPRDAALGLLHALQESLDNAVRHSQARNLSVALQAFGGDIHLQVSDNGMGFDPESAMRGRGLGLVHMRERLTLVGGDLTVHSRPGVGTTVTAAVPVATRRGSREPPLPLDAV